MDEIKDNITKEAKRIIEDSLYSSRGHFAAANRWGKVHLWIGIPTAIVSAVAGTLILSENSNYNIIAGTLAIIVGGFTALTTFLNPNEKANSHHEAGNMFNALRNEARMFVEIDCFRELSNEELTSQLKELSSRRDELNLNCPHIPRWAYENAKKSIEQGEADYSVDVQTRAR